MIARVAKMYSHADSADRRSKSKRILIPSTICIGPFPNAADPSSPSRENASMWLCCPNSPYDTNLVSIRDHSFWRHCWTQTSNPAILVCTLLPPPVISTGNLVGIPSQLLEDGQKSGMAPANLQAKSLSHIFIVCPVTFDLPVTLSTRSLLFSPSGVFTRNACVLLGVSIPSH